MRHQGRARVTIQDFARLEGQCYRQAPKDTRGKKAKAGDSWKAISTMVKHSGDSEEFCGQTPCRQLMFESRVDSAISIRSLPHWTPRVRK
jgi:hypothetical protein